MEYATSYFGNHRKLRAAGFKIISIAVGNPRHIWVDGDLKLFAPTREMLSMVAEEYDERMDRILRGVDIDILKSYLSQLKGRGYKKIAFCCHEKDFNDCHRKKVGEWLQSKGMTIEEFGYVEPKIPDAIQERLF